MSREDEMPDSSSLGPTGQTGTSPPSAQTVTRRAIPTNPFATIDVPGMRDDFYSQLISWSSQDMIAVSHLGGIMLWDRGSPDREVSYLHETTRIQDLSVNSIEFSNGGGILAIGSWSGRISIWDIETRIEVREIAPGRSSLGSQIQSLSWNQSILSSGGDDGEISHFDVRCGRAKVGGFQGHTEGVCGLKWRDDGKLLVSGCNGGSPSLGAQEIPVY
ncbi:hypothetical protein NLI96_g7687 [Meripilus lineatus]|uniref:Anaphase-promoting complex subunit 4-like WD40 domain-containing protein n=1 Tax=Meripilus lineatus TaxID=2056292 RepID=A0AAD5UYQ8_9APHY|nr:hypothetical protein NLI96_g7687 [Physisporinus lineatus]